MNVNINNSVIKYVMGSVQHFNYDKYWKRREKVVDVNCKLPKVIKLWYLFYIKRCDAFNCASMGTDLNHGASFKNYPILEHGINGIIISHFAKIGKNCTIYQQVTIAQDDCSDLAPVIGDNVVIGAGAKIIGNVKIGNNVKIGANCIVVEDIPDNSTVVLSKPRIIINNHNI